MAIGRLLLTGAGIALKGLGKAFKNAKKKKSGPGLSSSYYKPTKGKPTVLSKYYHKKTKKNPTVLSKHYYKPTKDKPTVLSKYYKKK